jgi:hypothetical protein
MVNKRKNRDSREKKESTPRNYWMLVLAPENFRVTQQEGFTVQGLQRSLKKKAQRIEVGDRLLFYLSRAQQFAATATVTAPYFEDHKRLWKSIKTEEDFPHRIHIEAAEVLEDEEFMDAREISPRMEYVKKWTPEWWPLAFIGDLHLIPRKDFSLIEDEMKKLISARTAKAS